MTYHGVIAQRIAAMALQLQEHQRDDFRIEKDRSVKSSSIYNLCCLDCNANDCRELEQLSCGCNEAGLSNLCVKRN